MTASVQLRGLINQLVASRQLPVELKETAESITRQLADSKIIEKLTGPKMCSKTTDGLRMLFLDTETTGLNQAKDRICEMAYMVAVFDRETLNFIGVDTVFCQLQDPGIPINPGATKNHGLTDADVRGKAIDRAQVLSDVQRCDIIVAQNADFDRRFVERENFTEFISKPWADTLTDIDWESRGVGPRALEFLGYHHGFWYDSHEAVKDVHATLEVALRAGAVRELVNATVTPRRSIVLQNTPFDAKDPIKEAGYQALYVNGRFLAWYRELNSANLEEHLQLFEKIKVASVKVAEITALDKFSDRCDELLTTGATVPVEAVAALVQPQEPKAVTMKVRKRLEL